MKRRLLFQITLFFLVFVLLTGVTDSVWASKKNIDLKGFDKFVNKQMDEWKVPGLAICILKDGKLIFSEGFGFRDIEKALPVTSNTLFAIGSCTKAFTTTAMGILVDEGKLDWDTPVQTYLPQFRLDDTFASERMTPRDLVCHRSGLPRHDMVWYNADASREELLNRLQYLKPSKDFRTTYQYQNLMFLTAGYMVGKITGTGWEKFIRTRLFDPLGMTDSNLSVELSKNSSDFAFPYIEKNGASIKIPFRNIDTMGPAGSINSSVTDMANWLLLNLSKGKIGDQQVISENSLLEIHSPQMISSNKLRYDELFYNLYGMGWTITSYRGHPMLHHGGGIDGFTALVNFLPKDNIGLAILANNGGTPLPQIIAYNAYDRLLGLKQVQWSKRLMKQKKKAEETAKKTEKDKDQKLNTKPSHPVDDYIGEYKNDGYGILFIQKKDESLEAVFNDIIYVMKHYHYDIFEAKNEMADTEQKISFHMDIKGNIQRLSIQLEPAVEPIIFKRMPDKIMRDRDFLDKLTGL